MTLVLLGVGFVHHLHALVWFIDRLAEGNPVAWVAFIGLFVLLVFAFIRDLRANKK